MIRHLACFVLLLAGFAGVANAQYQWRDTRGRMVFSDQPPPPGTPADRILRSPRPRAAAASNAADAAATAPAPPAARPASLEPPRAAPDYKDKAMAFEKRRKERAEAEAKADEARRDSADKARYCGELEAQRRNLASGGRIMTVGPDGKRRYLDEDARKARLDENAKALATACKG